MITFFNFLTCSNNLITSFPDTSLIVNYLAKDSDEKQKSYNSEYDLPEVFTLIPQCPGFTQSFA